MNKRVISLITAIMMLAVCLVPVVYGEEAENAAQVESELDKTEVVQELEEIQERYTDRYIIKRKAEASPDTEMAAAAALSTAQEAKHSTVGEILARSGETVESVMTADVTAEPELQDVKQALEAIDAEPAMLAEAEIVQVADLAGGP